MCIVNSYGSTYLKERKPFSYISRYHLSRQCRFNLSGKVDIVVQKMVICNFLVYTGCKIYCIKSLLTIVV